MRDELASADLVAIDLTGVDQLTDAFFRVLMDSKLMFPSMRKITLTGNGDLCTGSHILLTSILGHTYW